MQQFPITPYLSQICETLKNSESHFLILTAETGAGKSTVLPLGLLENFSGKILMTQPRRLAAVGVANRIASLREEECGKTVGYKVHLENCTSKDTRLEVVTEAVLVKTLSEDPLLENYNVIVIDEFHERTINTDLNLALLKEAVSVRDDLFVIVMSATIDTEKLRKYLSSDFTSQHSNPQTNTVCPVLTIPGRTFPIEVTYVPNLTPCAAILQQLKSVKSVQSVSNDILVFLPGISDIRKCYEELQVELAQSGLDKEVKVFILHSSISFEEQKKILNKTDSSERRVILSSAIAETSVTVPDITCVIDTGLARVSRLNVSTSMQNLVTEIESEFSAEQRKGRAGRLSEGKCIRLWSTAEPRVKNMPPEILRTDLSSFVLELFSHGITSLDKIDLLDKPQKSAFDQCIFLLQKLSLITKNASKNSSDEKTQDISLTSKGKAALSFPLEPRLASIVLSAGVKSFDKIEKLLLENSTYAKSPREIQNRFLNDIKLRLSKCEKLSLEIPPEVQNSAELLMLEGFPDRLAMRLSEYGAENPVYQFPGGRKAAVSKEKRTQSKWIIASEVMSGTSQGIIFSFTELKDELAEKYLESHTEKVIDCRFENGKIIKSENTVFGKIVLSSKKLNADDGDLLNAWINEIKEKGFEVVPKDDRLEKFILRAKFYSAKVLNKDISSFDEDLCLSCEEWLTPFMSGVKKLTSEIVYNALYYFLNGAEIDKNVPEILILPNKTKAKVKYEEITDESDAVTIRPAIEIIIQRIFGCFETPAICGQKVLLRLLSPASRPLQITNDLEHFWTDTWPEICKEMKGRYPKHNWDYRVVSEE